MADVAPRRVLALACIVGAVAVIWGCNRGPSPRAIQILVTQRVGEVLAPVAGARVELIPPSSEQAFDDVTDASGAVLFEGVPGGVRCTIRVTAGGYEEYSGQLPPDTVAVQGLVTQFVVLTPASATA